MTAVYAILVTFLWGAWGWTSHKATQSAHPFNIEWQSSVFGGILWLALLPLWYYLSTRYAPATHWNKTSTIWVVLSMLAAVLASISFLFGIKDAKSGSIFVALTSAYPLVTLALECMSGASSIKILQIVGIVVISIGVVLVSL